MFYKETSLTYNYAHLGSTIGVADVCFFLTMRCFNDAMFSNSQRCDVLNDVFQFLTMRCFNDVSENCQTSCKRCILTMFLWRFLFHTETKKYKCTQCKKHFSPNINLKSHSLVHTGVKPQRCTQCNYSANQGASLKKHILKHTGENPRHCQQCEHTSTLKVK